MLPDRIQAALPEGAYVVEVGVGGRFEVLAALAKARPDLELAATDVHERALAEAPPAVATHLDDATAPERELYEGADLILSVRCPVELQIPIARLARDTGASLALRAFKDEWADVDRLLGPHTLISAPPGAWRWWREGL